MTVHSLDALRRVRVMARLDGIFVVEIVLDAGFGYLENDLDELAEFICSAVKTALGHIHDSHNSLLHWDPSALDPARILTVFPVHVASSQWKPLFQAGAFTDADLEACDCLLPQRAPPGDAPRNALLCLRRSYLKVFEVVVGRLTLDRQEQVEWKKNPGVKLSLAFYSGIIAPLLLFTLAVDLPPPMFDKIAFTLTDNFPSGLGEAVWLALTTGSLVELIYRNFDLVLALAVTAVLSMMFAYFFTQFLRWDRRRIRLLRAARTFFNYVNPYNRIVGRVLGKPADSFDDIDRILSTKMDGEVHRASVHQFWITLTIAAVGVLIAALAIDNAEPASAAQPPSLATGPQSADPPQARANGSEDGTSRTPPHLAAPRSTTASPRAARRSHCQRNYSSSGQGSRRCTG